MKIIEKDFKSMKSHTHNDTDSNTVRKNLSTGDSNGKEIRKNQILNRKTFQ